MISLSRMRIQCSFYLFYRQGKKEFSKFIQNFNDCRRFVPRFDPFSRLWTSSRIERWTVEPNLCSKRQQSIKPCVNLENFIFSFFCSKERNYIELLQIWNLLVKNDLTLKTISLSRSVYLKNIFFSVTKMPNTQITENMWAQE